MGKAHYTAAISKVIDELDFITLKINNVVGSVIEIDVDSITSSEKFYQSHLTEPA
ncbi:MAG: hypothetical protein WA393_05760 [Nitrososphaeraceae archaeon]